MDTSKGSPAITSFGANSLNEFTGPLFISILSLLPTLPEIRSLASIWAVPDFCDISVIEPDPFLISGIDGISTLRSASPLKIRLMFFPGMGSNTVLPYASFAMILNSNGSPACAIRGDFITKEVSLFGKTFRSFETMGMGLPLSRTARVNDSATLSVIVKINTPFENDDDLKDVGFTIADP